LFCGKDKEENKILLRMETEIKVHNLITEKVGLEICSF
jgi:hypothetical protein